MPPVAPSWYGRASFPVRNGVFYVGGVEPSMNLFQAGATAYNVRDYYGNVVSSGLVAGTACTPTAPAGGWKPGWYRAYFTGPNSSNDMGNSYSVASFCLIRSNANFPVMPPGSPVYYGGEYAEPVAKGIMGLGTSRVIIANYATPTVAPGQQPETIAGGLAQIAASQTYWHGITEPNRERRMWCSTAGAVADYLVLAGVGGGHYLRVFCKTGAVDGAQTFVAASAGSVSGTKVQIYSPDVSTLVETFDNLGSSGAAAKINASSDYVRVFDGGMPSAADISATAIGKAVWDGIVAVVTAWWPDVTRYEFTNEPGLNAETAHNMRLFQAAVKAGNPAAKAIGPATVGLPPMNWDGYVYCDEISFHDYDGMTNGSLAHGRHEIEKWKASLESAGLGSKTLWQTEAGASFTNVYGIHHPRRARAKMMHTLLWEQYGVPRERNPYWYDVSHGFWGFPTFWMMVDGSLSPDAPLHRVLAEETWGMAYASRLPFGYLGDRVYLGSVYSGSSGSCVVLVASSWMPDSTVTLTVTGTPAALTVVDSFGNTSTVIPDADGRITVPVLETPTYVRLPVDVSAAVYRANSWPPVSDAGKWATSGVTGEVVSPVYKFGESAVDNGWMTDWATGAGCLQGLTMPDEVVVRWQTATRADRVLIWSGPVMNWACTLVDFDVQTSNDGTAWTTRATVTRPTPTSFQHGSDSWNVWCYRETYWDEQWIFDVPLPAPVTFKYLRLYVRATSQGGEPDLASMAVGGLGNPDQRIVIQEIAVLCDANTRKQVVVASGA